MVTNVRFRYIARERQHLRYAVIQRARAKLAAAEKIQTRITYMRPIRLIPVYHEHNKRSLHLRMCADELLFLQNCFLGCGKCAFKEVIMKAILHELNTYGIYRCLRRCLTTAMSSQAICHDKATRLIMKGGPHSVLIYLPISEVCKVTVIHRTSSPLQHCTTWRYFKLLYYCRQYALLSSHPPGQHIENSVYYKTFHVFRYA